MMSTESTFFHVTFLFWIISNAQMCPDIPKLRILPGSGWDALTNKDTKQILQLTYDQCKLTIDGKLLIPDNTFAVPINAQDREVTSQIFDHWSNYTSLSSAGFKVATEVWPEKFLPLYYSFSTNYQEMKILQVKHEAFTCRSELRLVLYRLHVPPNATIEEAFKERCQQVMTAVDRDDKKEAMYLTEMIISDYGTHYSKYTDVGTVIAMEDYLKHSFLQKHTRNKILSASKFTLVDYITDTGFALGDQQLRLDSSLVSEYKEATLKKKIRFSSGLNWEESAITECMVAIDRSGDNLASLVTSDNFPSASPKMLHTVKQIFSDVIQNYYTRNIHHGCTLPRSNNFDFAANLDDGSCRSTFSEYIFGGAYNTFQRTPYTGVGDHKQASENPLTGTLSCPTNFQSQVFLSYHYYSSNFNHVRNFVSCMALANDSSGPSYLFGGLYTHDAVNFHTQKKSCPQFYTALVLPGNGWTFCVSSTDNDLAKQYALHFGGLATVDTDYQCPIGYERHFAAPVFISIDAKGHDTVNYGKVYYCFQEQSVKNMGVVPPLIRFPSAAEEQNITVI